jgi:hypothetical protein
METSDDRVYHIYLKVIAFMPSSALIIENEDLAALNFLNDRPDFL